MHQSTHSTCQFELPQQSWEQMVVSTDSCSGKTAKPQYLHCRSGASLSVSSAISVHHRWRIKNGVHIT